MVVHLEKSVQQIIDNRFGEGQINIDILNSFLVSQGKSAIIKKRYSSTEKSELYKDVVKPYLKTIIINEPYKNSDIVLNLCGRLLQNKLTVTQSIKGINGKFFMRYRGKSAEDTLSYILKTQKPDNLEDNIKLLINNGSGDIVNKENITDIINNNKLEITETRETNVDAVYNKVKEILEILVVQIKKIFNINIAFWIYPNQKGTSPIEPKLISQNIAVKEQLYVNVNIQFDTVTRKYSIYFEEMILIDINKKSIKTMVDDIDVLSLYVKDKKQITDEKIKHITFNPFDKDANLPVVLINNKGIQKRYLLGNAPNYNLYLDDDVNNDLAGCIRFTNKEDREATVYWCKDN